MRIDSSVRLEAAVGQPSTDLSGSKITFSFSSSSLLLKRFRRGVADSSQVKSKAFCAKSCGAFGDTGGTASSKSNPDTTRRFGSRDSHAMAEGIEKVS